MPMNLMLLNVWKPADRTVKTYLTIQMTIEKTIVSRTYGTLHKGRCSARQEFALIKYTLIKTSNKKTK